MKSAWKNWRGVQRGWQWNSCYKTAVLPDQLKEKSFHSKKPLVKSTRCFFLLSKWHRSVEIVIPQAPEDLFLEMINYRFYVMWLRDTGRFEAPPPRLDFINRFFSQKWIFWNKWKWKYFGPFSDLRLFSVIFTFLNYILLKLSSMKLAWPVSWGWVRVLCNLTQPHRTITGVHKP